MYFVQNYLTQNQNICFFTESSEIQNIFCIKFNKYLHSLNFDYTLIQLQEKAIINTFVFFTYFSVLQD